MIDNGGVYKMQESETEKSFLNKVNSNQEFQFKDNIKINEEI